MKKNKLFTLLVVSGTAILLSSCATARVQINNADQPIVSINGETKVQIEANDLQSLFNKIYKDSNFASNVKDMLSEQISINYLGEYFFSYNKDAANEADQYSIDLKWTIGDKDTFVWSKATNEQKLSFIENHKFYWNWQSTGISVVREEKFDSTKLSEYEERIAYIENIIKEKTLASFYSTAVVSSYQKNSRYYETLFARFVDNQLYKLYDKNNEVIPFESTNGSTELSKLYLEPEYITTNKTAVNENVTTLSDGSKIGSETSGYSYGMLVDDKYEIGTYDVETGKGGDKWYIGSEKLIHLYHYTEYINGTIVPTIQSALLTNQYILDNQYPAIGRTQQRQVAFISLSDTTEKKAKSLLSEYATQYLSTLKSKDVDFSIASDAWKGVYSDLSEGTLAQKITKATFGEATNVNPNKNFTDKSVYIDGKAWDAYSYYKGSKYASIIEDYSKLTTNPITNDSSAYSSFTEFDSKFYAPEVGLEFKTNSLRAENYITKKWGTKTDFSALPSEAATKLFSYGIIKEINETKTATTAYDKQYLKTFDSKGPAFLKRDTYDTNIANDSIIWENGGSYYLIAVYDCVSPSLLTESDNNSLTIKEIEKKARYASYALASGSTYTNDALEYYITNSSTIYFDQKVYDYFVTTFPDIFDK